VKSVTIKVFIYKYQVASNIIFSKHNCRNKKNFKKDLTV
jgi:hypothetical protein